MFYSVAAYESLGWPIIHYYIDMPQARGKDLKKPLFARKIYCLFDAAAFTVLLWYVYPQLIRKHLS
jgi:hypothetical protein